MVILMMLVHILQHIYFIFIAYTKAVVIYFHVIAFIFFWQCDFCVSGIQPGDACVRCVSSVIYKCQSGAHAVEVVTGNFRAIKD